MNKNLKKVISTIAALAVSASSMVAFATGYPDVPETATYAQAVKELSALNVISGYEDGTFLPDKNVTRAEITKMIITSLGSATLSAANAAAGKDTKFADVPGSHWASGFVSTATANANSNNGFINGYDETTFGPDDNVTYAQAIKMLVSALGYQTYAENNGGWPNGYLNYGYTLEIADGVTGVSNDTQVTRAQVAQMIDNAIKAPICVIEGYTTQWNGTQTPNFKVKDVVNDGKNSWQCLLNYSHDTYIVNGRVTNNQKMNTTGASLKAGEVKLKLERSNNLNGYYLSTNANSDGTETVLNVGGSDTTPIAYVGDSKADQYLFTYAEMLLQFNEDDEITILSITPLGGESKTVVFAAEDFDDFDTKDNVMKVFKSNTSTATDKYELEEDAELYVNDKRVSGLKDTSSTFDADTDKFINKNVTGIVTLVDESDPGKVSVNGLYDKVMVSYYKDAIVDSVVGDEEIATIYFADSDMGEGTMEVDYTDDEKSYSFTLTDGTELTALDLQENDVLSIAYDPAGFTASNSYDVLVSRDTVEGKIASKDEDKSDQTKTEIMINGEAYGVTSETLVNPQKLNVSYEYLLYLNAFGKIAKYEETATSNKLAVLDNVYTANGDQYYATLILPDGTKESYTIKDIKTADEYQTYCYSDATLGNNAIDKASTKIAIQNRVWAYSVSSTSGNITLKGEDPAVMKPYAEIPAKKQAYKESSSKIGSVRINEALTSIIDVSEGYDEDGNVDGAVDIAAITADVLEDENEYTAYGFNKLSDNTCQFVIITYGTSGSVTYKTEFVVFSKSYATSEDGEDLTAYRVYEPGANEAVEVILDSACKVSGTIEEGTPIVIKKNSAGYAIEIESLFKAKLSDGYAAFASSVRDMLVDKTKVDKVLDTAALKKYMEVKNTGGESNWVFGAVYDRSGNSISIVSAGDAKTETSTKNGKATSGTHVTDIDKITEYDIDADANVITYSYKERAGRGLRVSNSVLSSIVKMTMNTAFINDDATLFDWDHKSVTDNEGATFGRTTFVLAKTIDNDIVEIYAIVPSTTRN